MKRWVTAGALGLLPVFFDPLQELPVYPVWFGRFAW